MGIMKKAINFRLTQQLAKGTARKLGFGGIAGVVGLIAGLRAYRRTH